MRVTILRGLSGAGKSTYAKHLAATDDKEFITTIVSADDYFMVDGKYTFDRDKLPQAHGACLKRFVETIKCAETIRRTYVDHIIVDNTNSTAREIAPYAALAAAYNCPFEIVTINIAPEVALARTTHNVPAKTINRMAERLEKEAKYFPLYWPHRVVEAVL